jgi:protein N-terminal methyltransferase
VDMEEEGGLDSDGRTYSSRKEMWEAEAGEDPNGSDAKSIAKKLEWYHKGVSYWESVEASVDGVLGGYGSVNARDVADSNAFILEMFNECPPGAGDLVALDCGAGVGRVTKNFLLHHFHEVMITCNPTQDMPGNISHPSVIAGHGVCLPFFWLLSLPSVV